MYVSCSIQWNVLSYWETVLCFVRRTFMFQASVSRQKKEEEVLNLEQLERQAVERAMRLSEGNVTRAAEYLGITRFALYRKLEKLGL